MSKKSLNQANLEKLGAAKLAALVMDLVQGNAALQRQARMELSAAQGPKEVASDIRKRFASLRRSTSYVDWRKQKALSKDLSGLLNMIETTISPVAADEAFELLWSFLLLAPSIHERTDDSNGTIGGIMGDAVDQIATISPRISTKGASLADHMLDAIVDSGYGEFDGIIPALSDALGQDGLEHLKSLTNAWAETPLTRDELDRYRGYGLSSNPEDSIHRNRDLTRSVILADIADAQGDVDTYMARYTPEQLTYGTIAPDVARRLLEAGRAQEAYDLILSARAAEDGKPFRMFRYDLDVVYENCLETLGLRDDLKYHLWDTFEQTLSAASLRKYLKLLPDFDDIEAEDKALDLAEAYPSLGGAINFLIEWPAQDRAAKTVLSRAADLNGDSYHTLTKAADALEADHPLAATLMRRAMVQDTLDGGKSKRYRYAARHLAECQSADAAIEDYGDFPTHVAFVKSLRDKHGRKYGFWSLVDE